MISFSMTIYSFVFMALCAILLAMIVGVIWYYKTDKPYDISDAFAIIYGIVAGILIVAVFFMLLIGIIGYDSVKFEAADYDIESMVADLRSDGIEVIDKTDDNNYLIDRYIPFTGKTKYYWHHSEKAEKYLINRRSNE